MTQPHQSDQIAHEFDALLNPVLGAAYGAAYRMTHNREAAEDLVQEAAVHAFRAYNSFEKGTNFKAWFLRILLNCFRSSYRKHKREPEITMIDDATDLYLFFQTTNLRMKEPNSNPAAAVISKMNEEDIQSAIAALPEEYRVVCVLYFLEEISYQEIADVLGCPVGTVRSRLHRGRKLLQKSLWQFAQDRNMIESLPSEREAVA